MPKRRHFLLLLAAVALAVAVLRFPTHSREPTYKGRPLSEWLKFRFTTDESPKAIRQLGTNVVPYFVKAIQYERPPWVGYIERFQYQIGFQFVPVGVWFPHSEDEWEDASYGFEVLGSKAGAAVPELVGLLCRSTNRFHTEIVAIALGGIGEPAVVPLLNGLTNAKQNLRRRMVMALSHSGTNAAPAIGVLLDYAQAQDRELALHAVIALGRIQGDAQAVVPVLTKALQDPDASMRCVAAGSLGEFREEARSSTSNLLEMLKDAEASCRHSASNALLNIAPEILTNAPPAKSL